MSSLRPSIFVALVAGFLAATLPSRPATNAYAQLASDSSFAGLVARLSEPNGYFDSDNIITNEASYRHISSQLEKRGTHGGVYMGVGPDRSRDLRSVADGWNEAEE